MDIDKILFYFIFPADKDLDLDHNRTTRNNGFGRVTAKNMSFFSDSCIVFLSEVNFFCFAVIR